MPRKAKETKDEEVVKKPSKLNKKINELIKTVFEPEEKEKKTTKKVAKSDDEKKATKKASKTKIDKETTTKVEKETTKKASKSEKETAKKLAKAEKEETKKATKAKKEEAKKVKAETKKTTKKTSTKKDADEVKTKKASTKKDVEEEKTVKKATTRKASTKKAKDAELLDDETTTKSTKIVAPNKIEYYDLPYKYNQTVVKVLYQNPTTLFVYWEISDGDIENYKNMYGENFFETTRPALIVYNDTMNYHFEIGINDFANSWYFEINDSKCDYRVELIRRPIYFNEKIKENYIYITSSNKIESPNDRILFSTNEPYIVYFKNTKNNNLRKVNLPKLIEKLNLSNKNFGFPIVQNVQDLYKLVYRVDDAEEFSVSLTNPSSGGNPSSHSLSSRFRY